MYNFFSIDANKKLILEGRRRKLGGDYGDIRFGILLGKEQLMQESMTNLRLLKQNDTTSMRASFD